MSDAVRRHYDMYPYPHYPLLASVRRCDTYALNLVALWTRFNGELPPRSVRRILIAGCGSFAPYPFALANPGTEITALDLSQRSLRRARLHCLLHGIRGVDFRAGDLSDPGLTSGRYGLIDAFGVLHHLVDPLAGLKVLAGRLADGGILRVMVYSRYARREEESIRRALRMLQVNDPTVVQRLVRHSGAGSRLRRFAGASDEIAYRAGLADALLHPCVHTYRIDEFMDLVRQSELEPLLFAHSGALADIGKEVARIRSMEADKRSPGNFILYLGRTVRGPCRNEADSVFMVNPCLATGVSLLQFGTLLIPPRMGHDNPLLGRDSRSFLRRFRRPVRAGNLPTGDNAAIARYLDALFLLQYRS